MPVEFHLAGAHLGFLDPGAAGDDDDLPARARVNLPLWLGATLAAKRMVRPELPDGYQRKFREVLDAGASAVDLRAQCANYYVVGDALARLLRRARPRAPRAIAAHSRATQSGARDSERRARALSKHLSPACLARARATPASPRFLLGLSLPALAPRARALARSLALARSRARAFSSLSFRARARAARALAPRPPRPLRAQRRGGRAAQEAARDLRRRALRARARLVAQLARRGA